VTAVQTVSALSPGAVHAHAQLLARRDLQFDFPALTNPTLPHWLLGFFKWLETLRPELQWLLFGGAGLLLLWLGGRAFWRRFKARPGGRTETPPPGIAWQPAPQTAKLLLDDADALAMAGCYGAAAHLLLLRGIQDIAERNPALLRPALTSREIGALQQLPQIPRNAFARIAEIVEQALFAGRALGVDDFSSARSEYERLALPAAWSADAA
jgi:hypothetical protein